jgi:HPt (histidine-containing phosphotransfer) domain-containing protein
MDGFVSKPFNVDELMTTIQKLTNFKHPGDTDGENVNVKRSNTPAAVDKRFPGINLEQGLDLWGEEQAYQEFLNKFSVDYMHAKELLNKHFANNDFAAIKTLSHKLKGAAGNLALVDVSASAAALEKAHENQIKNALDRLTEDLDTAFKSIQLYVSPTKEI